MPIDNVLFVGCLKQEKWSYQHKAKLDIKLFVRWSYRLILCRYGKTAIFVWINLEWFIRLVKNHDACQKVFVLWSYFLLNLF
jgi:hypothetical protein